MVNVFDGRRAALPPLIAIGDPAAFTVRL